MRRTILHPMLLLREALTRLIVLLACGMGAWGVALSAQAQGVELTSLQALRADGALTLDYNARLTLTPAVEDALKHGVPLYFVAQAAVYRNRWYWRDERLARVTRSWRLSYQPLTSSWRVSLGGLSQNYPTLAEACRFGALWRPSGSSPASATTSSSASTSTAASCPAPCRSTWAPTGSWASSAA